MHTMTKNIFFFILFGLLVFNTTAQQTPVVTSEGNSIYCPQTEQSIVNSFNIENLESLDALYIQISEGYSPGEDQLIYTGSNSNLDIVWNVSEGKLEISSLSGDELPIQEIINAVYDVVFFSGNPNPSDKVFSFTLGV